MLFNPLLQLWTEVSGETTFASNDQLAARNVSLLAGTVRRLVRADCRCRLKRKNLAWRSAIIHVKISNTETWDYPSDWGVARIAADMKKRLADLDRQDREWVASVPDSRKAQCRAIPPTTPFADQPHDCVKIFFSADDRAVPSGWEAEVRDAPTSIQQAMIDIAPWALGPPLAALAFGASVFWSLAGFRRNSSR
jgi:hypothetical protein